VSVSLRGLHPDVRAAAEWALSWARHYNVPVTVTSTRRTWAEQAELRRRWEAGLSKWPANRPGESSHEYGLSWDSTTEPWAQSWWNQVRTLAGFSVPTNDEIHAEVPNWRQYVR
jgi:hypothetical protein